MLRTSHVAVLAVTRSARVPRWRIGAVVGLLVAAAVAWIGSADATPPGKNGPIAFRRYFDPSHRTGAIFVINPDGTGERQLTHPPAGALDDFPRFAPDGSKLNFARSDSHGVSVWTVKIDGSGEQSLGPGFANPIGGAEFSPDGRLIAIGRAVGPMKHNNLKVSLNLVTTNGRQVRRLVDFGYNGDLGDISWAPDGQRLVYQAARFAPHPAHALFVIATRGGHPHRITPWRAGDIEVDWSPNGKLLLFRPVPANNDFGGDYYTMRPDGTHLHRLTRFPANSTTGHANWSPDGKSIVFANNGVGGQDDVYVMHADGSAITPVTRTDTWESRAVWGSAP
jgi:Tol biopolymer transport system component